MKVRLLSIDTTHSFSLKPWLWTLLLSTGLVVLIFLPPFVPPPFRMTAMAFFQPVCHQLPERSFFLEGIPLAVCHRCTGIYLGAWVGILLYPFLHARLRRIHAWKWLVIGSVPAVLDWGLTFLGLWENIPLSRLLTGSLAGLTIGLLVTRSLQFSVSSRLQKTTPVSV